MSSIAALRVAAPDDSAVAGVTAAIPGAVRLGSAGLVDTLPVCIYSTDRAGMATYVNAAAADLLGGDFALGTNQNLGTHKFLWSDGRPMTEADCPMQSAMETGVPANGVGGLVERADASRVPFTLYQSLQTDEQGQVVSATNMLIPYAGHADALVAANLSAIVSSSEDAIISKSLTGFVTSWNSGATKIFGYTADEMIGQPVALIVPPELLDEEAEILARQQNGERIVHFETVRLRKDGQKIDVSLTVSLIRDAAGRIVGSSKVARDITDRKQLEAQLRQAQKMEAIGQLAGGIAHDFNNLLTVSVISLDLLQELVSGNPQFSKLVQSALNANLRGAELTRRLLAFSRNQPLDSRALDVNEQLAAIMDMLQRTLGEQFVIVTALEPEPWNALADAAQLESAILNLAINARDAMGASGKLTIETANATLDQDYAAINPEALPGEYVSISVSDNGSGMPPEVLARVFEPFFTTKPTGEGTGLGLSMVYGFAKQSGGHIKIYSELGHGTTVRLYLPRTTDEAKTVAAQTDGLEQQAKPGETILLVEDKTDVREAVLIQLERLGYQVVQAVNGDAALEILRGTGRFDLVFTDIVMPGSIGGDKLAEFARAERPGIKVLLTSGFTRTSVRDALRPEDVGVMLNKPYRKEELAARLRAVLDAAA